MRVLLVAGFGAGLAPDLPLIDSLKFAGVRRDVTVEHIDEYAAEIAAYPNLYALCIVQSALTVPAAQVVTESVVIAQALVKAGLEHRSGIEIGNEPNLTGGWGKDAKQFQACVNACYQAIRAVSQAIDVVSGGVSNTGKEQQDWLKKLVNGLDPAVVVGYHTYRLESADTPQTGFSSRTAEQAALLAILGTRRHMNTETGWTCLKGQARYGPFGLFHRTVQLTEAQVASYVRREFQIAKDAGCESVSLYQLNDAVTGGFGIRRLSDGSLKPVAAIAAEFVEAQPGPPEPSVPLVSFRVLDEAGKGLAGVNATFTRDDGIYVVVVSDATGKITYRAWMSGVGVWVHYELKDYETQDERRLIPTVDSAGPLPEWPATVTLYRFYPRVSFRVLDAQGNGVAGASVTFRLDDASTPVGLTTGTDGQVTYRALVPGVGVTVTIAKDGFVPHEERRLIPTVTTDTAQEWAPTVTLESVAGKSFSKAQLAAIQCDLMIWCPDARPQFVNDYDVALRMRRTGDQGAVARGIEAGWVWSISVWRYPAPQRALIYAAAKAAGHTHFAIHVGAQGPGAGYHSIYPITQAECDGYGVAMNMVHQELLSHRLIPVCAGVAPDAPPAPGFNTVQVLVAMTDWDNSAAAASRIRAVAEAFPQAQVFYEIPEGEIYPKPSPDDPIAPTPDNGGAWIRGVQQRWPNFAGVVYEVNHPDGIESNVAQFTKCHAWWRDVPENQGEVDTYWKFWDNLGNDEARTYNDTLAVRCPWFAGSMSGWTMKPPPPDEDTTNVPTNPSVGDMIPAASIIVDDVPQVMTWPATGTITRVELRQSGVHVEFSKRLGDGSWPDMPFGIGGKDTLQFSMGLCLRKNGQWYAASPLQCWRTQDEDGGPIMAQAVEGTNIGQIPKNLFYDNRWPNLRGYQPQPGETIGLYCAAGDIRGFAATGAGLTVKERTNIVTFPLPAPGESKVFAWE